MSTMKKRIPMFLLALAMMVAMALPTFAVETYVYKGIEEGYYTFNVTDSSTKRKLHLNINNQNGTTASSKDDVIIYPQVNSKDQVWYASPQESGRWYLRHALNRSLALNINHSNNNCNLYNPDNNYTYDSNNKKCSDSKLAIGTSILLSDWNLRLGADTSKTWSTAYWDHTGKVWFFTKA